MSGGLKRRPSGYELAGALAPITGELPATSGVRPGAEPAAQPRPVVAEASAAPKKLVQVNFRASMGMARIIARLSAEHGSTRRLMAHLLRQDGHEVPDIDFHPHDPRRRYDD